MALAIAKKLNFRIGTKLTLMSLLGIFSAAGLLYAIVNGNAEVKAQNEKATTQQLLLSDMLDAKAALRGLQIDVRDIRLATSEGALQMAMSSLSSRRSTALNFIDPHIAREANASRKEQLQSLRGLLDQFVASGKEIADTKTKIFALELERTEQNAANIEGRIQTLNQQAAKLAREKTLPVAQEMEGLTNKIGDLAQQLVLKDQASAVKAMEASEFMALSLGGVVMLVLVCAALFGALSVARPLRKMADVLSRPDPGSHRRCALHAAR